MLRQRPSHGVSGSRTHLILSPLDLSESYRAGNPFINSSFGIAVLSCTDIKINWQISHAFLCSVLTHGSLRERRWPCSAGSQKLPLCCAESNLNVLCFWVLLILLFPKGRSASGKLLKPGVFEGDLRHQKHFVAKLLGCLLLQGSQQRVVL